MAACSGLSSGALFVQLQGEALRAEGGILDGAKPFLHDLVLTVPSIESQLAPWQLRVRSLRQRRNQTRVGSLGSDAIALTHPKSDMGLAVEPTQSLD